MTRCAIASILYFATLTTVGFCVRPEKVDSLKKMFSDASAAAPCGLEVFQTLGTKSTLGDARALFLSGCEEKYPSEQCTLTVEELWLGRDLASTSGLEMNSDLCESLRRAVVAAERSGLTQYSEQAESMETSISRKLRRSSGSVKKDLQVSQKSEEVCSNPTYMTLNQLPETGIQGGRCMDGTTAGFYYAPPSGDWHSSSLWVIFLEGGGACYTKKDCDRVVERTKYGSNRTWGARLRNGQACGPENLRFLSNDSTYNPHFHHAHHVHVNYCTQDTHAGTVRHPTADDQWGYYFDGHLNFKAVVAEMIARLPPPSRILLYGSSAGGKGTIFNCDWLRRKMNREGRSADVYCNTQSGWFMPGDAEDNLDDPLAQPTPWEFWKQGLTDPDAEGHVRESVRAWQTYFPPECTNAQPEGEQWRCSSAHVLYPHIVAPFFLSHDIFDSNMIMAQLGLPDDARFRGKGQRYVAYFGRAMLKSTEQIVNHPFGKTGDGLFLTSCFMHGSGLAPRLGNPAYHKDDAIADWFWRTGEGQVPNILIDDCEMESPGLPCNPNCSGVEDPL